MNDPHVAALHYAVIIGPGFNFDRAGPLGHVEADFEVVVDQTAAIFSMRRHFASEHQARAVVQPFVDAWNVNSGLKNTSAFRLEYWRAELIDRTPIPGVVHVQADFEASSALSFSPQFSYNSFSEPPTNFIVSPQVTLMYTQYSLHREGKIPLVHMCYFVLTVIEHPDRRQSAKTYAVDRKILSKIGHLTAKKGGAHARKREGVDSELTPVERTWLEAVVPILIIRRAGEVAANPGGIHKQLTLADLPPI